MNTPFDVNLIFKNYKDKIYRLALSIARNDKDAEDIVQNTFLKITKNLKKFKNKSQISTWIYRIAYNEALMFLRKRQRQFKLARYLSREKKTAISGSGIFVNWSKLADEELLGKEIRNKINDAIRQMPIKYRMSILLHKIEGFNLRETSKILGLKENSLKTRMHRGYMFIRSQIEDYYKDKVRLRRNKRCSLLTGFIQDYAKGKMDKKGETAFKTHIRYCLHCNSFLNGYLKAIRITGALQCQDLPLELQEKIKSFILENKTPV